VKSTTDVNREIRRIVGERVDAGIVVRVEWLTQEILSMKSDIEGGDADFYLACGVRYIHDAVKNCIGAYKPKPNAAPNAQIVMDGFDYMQRAYSILRDDEIVLVPVDQLSDKRSTCALTSLRRWPVAVSRTPKSCEIIVLFAELRPDVLERFLLRFRKPSRAFWLWLARI